MVFTLSLIREAYYVSYYNNSSKIHLEDYMDFNNTTCWMSLCEGVENVHHKFKASIDIHIIITDSLKPNLCYNIQ